MKVGIDGILLGSWVDVNNCENILDVGTGTGLIALMLAQRTVVTKITAIEIEKNAATEALKNVHLSRWSKRIDIHNVAFQKFAPDVNLKYDLIVSNPPFFQKSQKTKSEARTLARHNDLLPFSVLLKNTSALLRKNGRGAFILPLNAENEFCSIAEKYGLTLLRKAIIFPNPKKSANRVLLEFGKEKSELITENIIIYDDNGLWSKSYKKLTKDFYLYI